MDQIISSYNQIYNGEIGLAPRSSGNAELFIDALFKAGVIFDRAFGTNFKSNSEASKITIGGYDETVVPDFNNFQFASLINDYEWQLSCSQVAYDGVDQGLDVSAAILSTGSSLTRFESSNGDWDKIYSNITAGKTCGYSNVTGLRACECKGINDFKDINFVIGGHELTMKVDTWVRRESTKLCSFYIGSVNYSNLTSTVILGYAFMRNHYIYYDLTNKRVGFYDIPELQSEGYLPTTISISLLVLILAFVFNF